MKKNNGFTLVELMVVVAILGILSAIGAIVFINVAENANKEVCLSSMTSVIKRVAQESTLSDETLSEIAQKVLTNENKEYFTKDVVCPKGGTYSFVVDNATGAYDISCSVHGLIHITNTNVGEITVLDFSSPDFDLDDYLANSHYRIVDGQLVSNYGLFLSEVEMSDHYLVETTATLSGSGGYGVLIETDSTSASDDNGFAVQFDKGLNGKVVIRPRTDGGEGGVLDNIRLDVSDYIPNADNDDWWNETHTFSVEVEAINDTENSVSVYIDGVAIYDPDLGYSFLVDDNENADKIGLRTWSSDTYFDDLQYTNYD